MKRSTVWQIQSEKIENELSKSNNDANINKALNNYRRLGDYLGILWYEIHKKWELPENYITWVFQSHR
ncbi:hypothetical protein FACS189479_03290 [Spirochaetia bacterium]|nr:hypothetical protein FACS189479_03290 [Spirochaetia bacterium]